MAQSYEDAIVRRNFQSWDCVGQSPVWGQSRQALVSVLPWFHQLQSGFANLGSPNEAGLRPACGLLVNDYGSNRTYLDTELIIVSINSASSNAQVTARRLQAMKEAIEHHHLIGFIVGRGATHEKIISSKTAKADGGTRNVLFPGNKIHLKGFESFVLDWFLPTYMWSEGILDDKAGADADDKKTKTVWMVKLQKQHLDRQSWWASKDHPPPPRLDDRDFSVRTTSQECANCGKSSPIIYDEGFVCFNENCTAGPTHLAGNLMSQDQTLTYSQAFLQERSDPRLHTATGPDPHPEFAPRLQYSPSVPPTWTDDSIKEEISRLLQTFVCPSCGMANIREKWKGWFCTNDDCTLPFSQIACPPRLGVADAQRLCKSKDDLFDDDIEFHQHFTKKYPDYYQGCTETIPFKTYNFTLMDTCKVALLVPKKGTNQAINGSDYFFDRLQTLTCTDPIVQLSRRRTKRGFLTSHFSQNFGAPYQMTVATDDTSFEQAPDEIKSAVGKANEWTAPYRSSSDLPFNEMYLGGYLQSQSMGLHQDNEPGLNDKILTWSLGGSGLFRIAVQTDICNGKANIRGKDWIKEDPLVPGCRKYAERVALKAQLDKGKITQDVWETEFQKLMEGVTGGNGREVLKLPAAHGCLILMYGSKMQTYYQHRVDVVGPFRFALTFRHIGAENQAPRTKRKARTQGDAGRDDNVHDKSTPGDDGGSGSGRGRGRSPKKARPVEGTRAGSSRTTRSMKKT